jgi:hypothetical protein
MLKLANILLLVSIVLIVSCNKESDPDEPILPVGAAAYTEVEVAFVPYVSDNQIFKKSPDFTEELILNFKERLATKEFFAWDQTFFTLSSDPYLDLELRLRYLKAENETFKTLAIYMPYRDELSYARTNVFELPIDDTGIATGFFSDLITYHPTISINGVEWTDVYEVNPLTSTDAELDSPTNFSKVFYNTTFGLIEIDQKNGDKWILHP